MKIKPTVHMIWLGSPVPRRFEVNVYSYKSQGYEVKIWMEPLENMVNKKIFDQMTTWAGKADIMRLEILYRYGGIYTDIDSIMLRPLFIPPGFSLVCMVTPGSYIGNETIYAEKGHPGIKEAIDGLKHNVEMLRKRDGCNLTEIAGARYLTPILDRYNPYKYPRRYIGNGYHPDSIIYHQYNGSWARGIPKSQAQPISFWLKENFNPAIDEIPKKMFTIWVGDESKRPDRWLQTWRDKHPDWEYRIIGNEVFDRKWRNQHLIDQYRKEERWAGVADVIRYEVLFEEGGFIHPADSVCLHNIDELLQGCDAIAVYENEAVRPGLISPLYGCSKGNLFAKALIDNLPAKMPKNKDGISKAPWQVTGNKFMQRMVSVVKYPHLKIVPSYTFTPIHHTGHRYKGNGKVYAVQQWGTTSEAGIGLKEYNWKHE